MEISFKQALKAPLSWKLLIVAFLVAFPSLFAFYYGIDLSGKYEPLPTQPVNTLSIISGIFLLLIVGYYTLFAHNRINAIEPVFPNISWKLIKTSLKSILFALGTYIVVLFVAFLIFIINYTPVYIAAPIGYVLLFLCAYYIMVATIRFADTLLMRTPFQLTENTKIMRQYWKSFLRLVLYNVGILIVLFIPAWFFNGLVLEVIFMAHPTFNTLVATTFIYVLIRAYITFVGLHVFAQVYAWIKADRALKAKSQTITVKPVSVTITSTTAQKKTVKKVIAKKSVVKASKAAPKKAVKGKNGK